MNKIQWEYNLVERSFCEQMLYRFFAFFHLSGV